MIISLNCSAQVICYADNQGKCHTRHRGCCDIRVQSHPLCLQLDSKGSEENGDCHTDDTAQSLYAQVGPDLDLGELTDGCLHVPPSQEKVALKPCLTRNPLQVIEGKDILWEGELPGSLSIMTPDELEQALQSQQSNEPRGAVKRGMHSLASGRHSLGHTQLLYN